MKSPDSLRKQLRGKWSKHRHAWLADSGTWPLPLSIGGESLKVDSVVEHWSAFDAWLGAWKRHKAQGSFGHIVPKLRFRNSPIGEQEVPCYWMFDTPDAVAAELGEAARWQRAKQRFDRLASWLPVEPEERPSTPRLLSLWRRVVARRFDLLADVEEGEFELLLRVVHWLWKHPDSGVYLRQLPVAGIDTKWVERRRRVITAWVWVLRGGTTGSHNFHRVTGLRAPMDRLRLRLLDVGLRARLGGLSDIEAPAADVMRLSLPVQRVLIVENLVTGLACEDLPGTAVFMGRGYAIEALANLPWLASVPVHYWGDIDTHGLAILGRLRRRLPHVRALLMDQETLQEHRALAGREPQPHPAQALGGLTMSELQLFMALRGNGERLEQERIPWAWAWPRVMASMLESNG